MKLVKEMSLGEVEQALQGIQDNPMAHHGVRGECEDCNYAAELMERRTELLECEPGYPNNKFNPWPIKGE